jgi:hypothetical protein
MVMHAVSKVMVCVLVQYQVSSPGRFHDFLGPACGGGGHGHGPWVLYLKWDPHPISIHFIYFMVIKRWIVPILFHVWSSKDELCPSYFMYLPYIYLIVINQLFPLISHFPRQWGKVSKFWYIPKNRNAFLDFVTLALPSFIRHSRHYFHCLSVPS